MATCASMEAPIPDVDNDEKVTQIISILNCTLEVATSALDNAKGDVEKAINFILSGGTALPELNVTKAPTIVPKMAYFRGTKSSPVVVPVDDDDMRVEVGDFGELDLRLKDDFHLQTSTSDTAPCNDVTMSTPKSPMDEDIPLIIDSDAESSTQPATKKARESLDDSFVDSVPLRKLTE